MIMTKQIFIILLILAKGCVVVNAQEKFNAGKISVYEHLQAKQKLASSQSQSVQAKYELAYKLAVYDYYYNR